MDHFVCQLVTVSSDQTKVIPIGGIDGANAHLRHERDFCLFYKLSDQEMNCSV